MNRSFMNSENKNKKSILLACQRYANSIFVKEQSSVLSHFPIVKIKVCVSSLSESEAVIQKAKDSKEISQKHL